MRKAMKFKRKLVLLGSFICICGLIYLFLSLRSPILVVNDEPFILLYGKQRVIIQQFITSVSYGRMVKQVIVTDAAGTDLQLIAIEQAASKPWCVVFPGRYAEAAGRYQEQFPDVPVILLS